MFRRRSLQRRFLLYHNRRVLPSWFCQSALITTFGHTRAVTRPIPSP
jgi:hypothetical protein